MIDSDWLVGGSVVMGEKGAFVGDPELPVDPAGWGQGQQPLADADEDPAQGAAMVLFQPELVLEGVDDRLDPLAHAAKRPEPARLVLAVRTDQPGAQLAEVLVERPAGKALVGQDDRARRQRLLVGGIIHQRLGDLALAKAGGGQTPADRHAVGGAEQIQLEAPVPAAVAAVIAIGGMAPQRRALDRLAGLAAGQRGGPEQDLGNRQTDQLGVAELGPPARAEPWTKQLIDGDVQCDDEVVETGVHEASQEVDVATATPTLGGLVPVVTAQLHRPNSESTI